MNWTAFTDPDITLPGEAIPGLFGYRRMSHNEYLAFPGVNAGLLKCRTAAEMYASLTAEEKQKDALTEGTLTHMACLEPETSWKERFAVADIPINPRTGQPFGPDTKKAAPFWEAAREANPGKIIVTPESFHEYMNTCRDLQWALSCSPDAMQELQDIYGEVTGIMWHPRWNCWVKWRPDILPKHMRYLGDIKTTSRHVADFGKDAWQWGYYVQAVFYSHCHTLLCSRANIKPSKFVFIAISKEDNGRYPRPAMCRPYDLPLDPALNKGVEIAMKSLGLPEGLSRVDVFLNCLREHIDAGSPTVEGLEDPVEIRRTKKLLRAIWPAFELEEKRWILD